MNFSTSIIRGTLSFIGLVLVVSFLIPEQALSRLGVGVGVGSIQVDEEMKPGGLYDLPSIPVINTGDEPANYGVTIQYHEGQEELLPNPEWFRFEPETFYLEPRGVQVVHVMLDLPIKTTPGDYFAYLEAGPLVEIAPGVTSVGIGAAVKLYFTVKPANFIQGVYYKTISFIKHYSPWTYIVLIVILLAIIVRIFRKNFSFNIGIQRRQ